MENPPHWKAFGRVLEALAGHSRKRAIGIRFSGTLKGPSWRALGAVLALGSPPWAYLGRLGVVLGHLKIDAKNDSKIDALHFLIIFSIIFLSDVGSIALPTCLPKSTKIHQKSMPRCLPKLTD